jgi:hypothetical protein
MMNPRDEDFRATILDCFSREGIDTRNVSLEVDDGVVKLTGSVPSEDQRSTLERLLKDRVANLAKIEYEMNVIPVAASDSVDGKGRSPLTGTSEGSAHESDHQLDRT